ncbi:thiamine ABC transporter ATP-binding protein [Hoeflea poritis]|uniref:Thiamine ABC transporter ATP-binding protein n=1 Tax=Hoeflea poritis TaxID=2993659 RepID=A0ABT4VLV9_9HYPH|nr:thiamine ABC transporter ATP-binding protein [Hoeflea poritis]MDA4845698.1 thiamine ABC transporter ATP-binding protein [Hoeflea poritis]
MIGETLKLDAVTLRRETFDMRFDTQVEAGTIAAIIGPSGAGKSTLLNLIAGFETPDGGRLSIGNADVTDAEPSERPVTMVFQENNLFSHLDVATNVSLGIRPRLTTDPSDRALVTEALSRVGLAGFEARMPGSLSGGERQRVAIARAVVRRRPVLLLDEPFAALGPRLRRDMLLLVRQLQVETGMTVLIVTHQPEEAAAIADTIIFLDKGRTVATGPADGFFERDDVKGLADYLGQGEQ